MCARRTQNRLEELKDMFASPEVGFGEAGVRRDRRERQGSGKHYQST